MSANGFHYVGRYKAPLLYHAICLPDEKNAGLPALTEGMLLDGHSFFLQSQWQAIKKAASGAILAGDEAFFRRLFSLVEQRIDKLLRICKFLEKGGTISEKGLAGFFNCVHQLQYPWWFSVAVGEALEEILIQKLRKGELSNEQLAAFFSLKEPTFLIRQKQEMGKIAGRMRKDGLLGKLQKIPSSKRMQLIEKADRPLEAQIRAHVKKYRWYGMMHFWGEMFSEEKFLREAILSKRINSPKPPPTPSGLRQLYDVSVELNYWRQMCADVCAIASLTAMQVLGANSRKLGLSYQQAMWLTPEEYMNSYRSGKKPTANIPERRKGFGVILKNHKIEIITDGKLEKLLKRMLPRPEIKHELKGVIANSGIAVGAAKIVLTPKDLGKIRQGDVLIAPETTPDFIPALSLVKAIITDLGGIGSHAAIISREFGIPCIVGTRYATRLLKDGDRVKVDAVRGFVRKIS